MTSHAASNFYKVIKTKIINHVTNRSSSFNSGRPTVFTKNEEKQLVDHSVALKLSTVLEVDGTMR